MAEMTWLDQYRLLVSDCQQRDVRMSDWERDFIKSIAARLDSQIPLTPRQTETLDSIWEKVTRL